MKTLVFEGAGWDKAEHNGVGNCRIRTTFINSKGVRVYVELIGHAPHKYSPQYVKNFKFAGFVSHLLLNYGNPKREGEVRSDLEGHSFEYTKENILKLVNSREVGGNFENIEVKNTDWNGFAVDGKPEVSNV